MIFSKFFHLSREGTRTIMQAGIWLAVFNLAALLPWFCLPWSARV